MNTKVSVGLTVDKFKLGLALVVLVASLVGFYYYQDFNQALRVAIVLAGFILSLAIVYTTNKGREWFDFLGKTRKEIRQVVWPNKKEVGQTTLMIVIAVIIVGIFLWLVDKFFFWMIKLITS